MTTDEDDVFKALADPSRRKILDHLRRSAGATLGELCAGHDMTRQALSRHVSVLERANLVTSVRRGREKLHYLNSVPIHEISSRWIGRFERARLDALRTLTHSLSEDDHE